MRLNMFYRNVRSRGQLELLLLAAASSVLLLRFYLHLTGYPQIGSGNLHIAHMLWGGALMLLALVITLSFLGSRAQRLAALIGGIGFGVFIDELGKFITRDNNYFYQPAIGLIYAIFIGLYLAFNFLSRQQQLSNREYQLNALVQFEEAIAHDMNPAEKAGVAALLARADATDPLTRQLQEMLRQIETIPSVRRNYFAWVGRWFAGLYEKFLRQRHSNVLIRSFFIVEALLFASSVLLVTYVNINGTIDVITYASPTNSELVVGQLGASLLAVCFAVWGAAVLPRSRLRAYEQFRRATLVTIFLTQFFLFARIQFAALPGFFFNLALLGLITYVIRQEQRLQGKPAQPRTTR